ncbi:hypothetical protein ACFSQ7_25000 [Paenibacillus rhizoplanae]
MNGVEMETIHLKAETAGEKLILLYNRKPEAGGGNKSGFAFPLPAFKELPKLDRIQTIGNITGQLGPFFSLR